jgi:hypothetical protein
MPKQFGGLIKPSTAAPPQGVVSFSGPDANGLVTWTFKNIGGTTGSWVLQRGASLAGQQFEDYVFGQAFNVIYLYNGAAFATSLLTAPPTPLVDQGTANNSAPMAIVDAPTGRSICFVFTLTPGQTWSMEEGGFSGGVVPSNPQLIPVTVKDASVQYYCDAYQAEQCQGYNQQAGTNFPCPPNPWQIQGILMETTESIPILIADTITAGPCGGSPAPSGCEGLLDQAISEFKMGEFGQGLDDLFAALECYITSGAFSREALLRKLLHQLRL